MLKLNVVLPNHDFVSYIVDNVSNINVATASKDKKLYVNLSVQHSVISLPLKTTNKEIMCLTASYISVLLVNAFKDDDGNYIPYNSSWVLLDIDIAEIEETCRLLHKEIEEETKTEVNKNKAMYNNFISKLYKEAHNGNTTHLTRQ